MGELTSFLIVTEDGRELTSAAIDTRIPVTAGDRFVFDDVEYLVSRVTHAFVRIRETETKYGCTYTHIITVHPGADISDAKRLTLLNSSRSIRGLPPVESLEDTDESPKALPDLDIREVARGWVVKAFGAIDGGPPFVQHLWDPVYACAIPHWSPNSTTFHTREAALEALSRVVQSVYVPTDVWVIERVTQVVDTEERVR